MTGEITLDFRALKINESEYNRVLQRIRERERGERENVQVVECCSGTVFVYPDGEVENVSHRRPKHEE